MALTRTVRVPGVGPINGTYWLISSKPHDKLLRTLSFTVTGYVSAEERDGLKAAMDAIDAAWPVARAASLALEAAPLPQPLDEATEHSDAEIAEHARLSAAHDAANAAAVAAHAVLSAAQAARWAFHPLPLPVECFVIDAVDVPAMLVDPGDPDKGADSAKLYAWLQQQPGWTDAVFA